MKLFVRKNKKKTPAKYLTYVHGSRKPIYVAGAVNDIDERGMKSIATVKLITGVLLSLLFVALVLIAFTEFIFPFFVNGGSETSAQSAVRSEESEESVRLVSEVTYDSTTGLELYSNAVNLFVVNSKNPVDESFSPEIEEIDGVKLDKRIIPAIRMMMEAAANDGVSISLKSGYVSYAEQDKLFTAEVNRLIKAGETSIMAKYDAAKTVAPAGEADEESGFSVKLSGNAASFTESNVYNWLNNNAAKYGFVFRYPEGKTNYTGKNADYTVIRYVGPENAVKMRQLSVCLEEYIAYVGN